MKKKLQFDTGSQRGIITIAAVATVAISGLIAAHTAVGPGKKELAAGPVDLSWKSWKRALLEAKNAIGNKNLGPLAASIAYGGTLAFFPLVVACVAIASIIITPEQIGEVVTALAVYLPADIAGLISAQLENALHNDSANIIVAVIAIGIALVSVSSAMDSLTKALNATYERVESRGFIKTKLTSIALTLMMVAGFLLIVPLVVVGGDLLHGFGVPELLVTLFSVLRWFVLAAVVMLGLAIIYRYAPDRPNARWQWVSWGAAMAAILWLIVTALFFIYVQYFAGFSDSYSLFAGIIVLMMWLNFSGLVILIGAEVNYRLEQRTIRPTSQ